MSKRSVRVLGVAVAVAALGYFINHARRSLSGVDLAQLLDSDSALASAALVALYTVCVIPNAAGWRLLMKSLGQRVSLTSSIMVLATTQIGKYLPGNVAHHVGRVALIRSHGVGVAASTYSLGYEVILSALASCHIGAIVLLWSPPAQIAGHPALEYRLPILLALTVAAVGAILLAPLGARLVARRRAAPDSSDIPAMALDLRSALLAYGCFGSTFVAIGFGLWLLATTLSGTNVEPPLFFVGAFAASWIIGFLAPGAPAGLGVREALLSAWFGSALPPAQAVLLIVALRLATTVGDLINFLLGSVALTLHTRSSVPK